MRKENVANNMNNLLNDYNHHLKTFRTVLFFSRETRFLTILETDDNELFLLRIFFMVSINEWKMSVDGERGNLFAKRM
jgi:hypothetical protein